MNGAEAIQKEALPARPVAAARVATFLELIKFSHTIFILPFALIAAFMASRAIGRMWPGFIRTVLVVVCMASARTFAMTVNRLADLHIDRKNARTARRPSVTGAVSVRFMAAAIGMSAIVFVLATALFGVFKGNYFPLYFSGPVLAWVALYSFTKRFTWMCHFFLGSSLMLGPLSAWVAVAPPRGPLLAVPVVLLALAVLFWSSGFDILYALQDEAVDRSEGLYSIPARVGRRRALWISRGCHVATVALLAALGAGAGGIGFGTFYWVGFGLVVLLLGFEQSLVTPDDISRVNLAFMTVNGVLGVVFATLTICDLLGLGR